jgi:hypothetical protein
LINNRQNGRRRGRGGGQGAPRSNGSGGGQDRGNRIDNRARGNAAQLLEKYKALARDAQMQGDRVNTEYYLQFADHYFRVLSESRSRFEEQQPRPRRDDFVSQSDEDYGDEGDRAGEEPRQQPEPIFAMRETESPRDFGDRQADGNRSDDGPGRETRNASRDDDYRPLEASDQDEPAAEEPPTPRRRGRPAKPQPSEQIEVDRLPPSFSLQTQDEGDGEKPRPRTRRPRGEAASA